MANDSNLMEWQTLQKSSDLFEIGSLVIKLFTILLTFILLYMNLDLVLSAGLVLILWLQDAIWKTFQSRFDSRILQIEHSIKMKQQGSIEFQTNWENTRPGTIGLVVAYLSNAVRPTVAYPYIALLGLLAIQHFL